jgi:hypothetical protein
MAEDASAEARMSSPGERSQCLGQPAHDVFVSYCSRDKPVTDAVVSRLEQAGIRCWVAPRDVIPGRVFAEAIVRAIETTRLMVVVFSGEANQSHHVLREVERAVANNVVIIPFRIETIEPSAALAYYLASEHWLDAMTPPLESHIAKLVKVANVLLDNASTTREEAPWPPPVPPVQPAQVVPPAPVPPAPVPPAPVPPAPTAWWRGRWRWLAVAASLAVLGVVGAFLLFRSGPQQAASPQQAKMVALRGLMAGDCVQTPQAYARSTSSRLHFWNISGTWPPRMPVVACKEPHSAEVFWVGNAWSATAAAYPGGKAINKAFYARCDAAFKTYVGIPQGLSVLSYTGEYPNASGWAIGDRRIFCVAFDPSGSYLKGSIKGSHQ